MLSSMKNHRVFCYPRILLILLSVNYAFLTSILCYASSEESNGENVLDIDVQVHILQKEKNSVIEFRLENNMESDLLISTATLHRSNITMVLVEEGSNKVLVEIGHL